MMRKWLEERGGELNKAWMHEFSSTNKGMVATENIKEGELIAFIPRSMIVTEREAEKSSSFARQMGMQ